MNDPRVRAHHLIYAHKYPPDENAKQVIEGLLSYCGSIDAENERLRGALQSIVDAAHPQAVHEWGKGYYREYRLTVNDYDPIQQAVELLNRENKDD